MIRTLDDCDEAFDRLSNEESEQSRTEILDQLFAACDVINVVMGRSSNFFWRARRCAPEGWANERDVWHPPAAATKPGRLNKAGEPVLYLSTNEETALAEIGALPGEHVQLTAYKLMPGESYVANCIGEVEHLIRTGYLRTFGVDPDGSLMRMIHSESYEKARTWAYIDAYLARLLTDPKARDSNYDLTQLVAQISYKRSKANAMFYPSVRSDIGMNLGVQAEAAKSFQPTISFVTKIGRIRRFNFHDMTAIRRARGVADGRFLWQANPVTHQEHIVFNATQDEFKAALRNRARH